MQMSKLPGRYPGIDGHARAFARLPLIASANLMLGGRCGICPIARRRHIPATDHSMAAAEANTYHCHSRQGSICRRALREMRLHLTRHSLDLVLIRHPSSLDQLLHETELQTLCVICDVTQQALVRYPLVFVRQVEN